MLNYPTWKKFFVLAVILAGIFIALPNVTQQSFLPQKRLNLGLDLRGGSHLLLEVDVAGYLKQQYQNELDLVRKTLRAEKIGYKNLRANNDGVSVELREAADVAKAQKLLLDAEHSFEIHVTEANPLALSIAFKKDMVTQKRDQLIEQSIEIIGRRVNENGTKEPIIQRQGADRIVLQVAGQDDPQEIKSRINTTAKLSFHLVKGSAPVPAGTVPTVGYLVLPDNEGKFWEVEETAILGGENLDNAMQAYDAYGNVAVAFKFDNVGGKIFGDVTKANVGKPFASVLDGRVISVPVIREPILGGQGQVTGNFTVKEATELATLLRAGALPASLKVLEERSVGASLGNDSIAAGSTAAIIGFALVVMFMFAFYGFLGVVANVALLCNVVLIVACLTMFQATLTLPGIAGIVLTMGMAVDANVLIYERIREELSLGQKLAQAIDAGFERAFATIFDSNITTLMIGLLLYWLGSGTVKGFAVTLCVGIICSMFTAVLVAKWVIYDWYRLRRPTSLGI